MEKRAERRVGKVAHYYSGLGVAVVEMEGELRVGDEVAIRGYTTDFTQRIESMEMEHERIEVAKRGDSIGLKVKGRVREGDLVYSI
jgi:putative protease